MISSSAGWTADRADTTAPRLSLFKGGRGAAVCRGRRLCAVPPILFQVCFRALGDLCLHLLGGFLILRTDGDIGLELRLGAGGAHHDGAVVFQQELEHVGLGQAIQTRRVVQQLDDLPAAKLLDAAPECLHDALHLGKTGAAIELIAVQGVQAVAVGLVQLLQLVQQADALGGIVAEHLADHIGAVHAVLVADVGAGQIAIALLKAEHIAVGPALLFQLADIYPMFQTPP